MKVNAMRGSATSLAVLSLALLGGCATTHSTPASQPATKPAPAKTQAKPAPAPAPAPAKPTGKTSYQVMKGDNLWDIAGMQDIYGNPYEWPLIYKANSGKINDPDLIFPGEQLKINQSASTMQKDAAIYHAKHRGAWTLGQPTSSDVKYLKDDASKFLKSSQ